MTNEMSSCKKQNKDLSNIKDDILKSNSKLNDKIRKLETRIGELTAEAEVYKQQNRLLSNEKDNIVKLNTASMKNIQELQEKVNELSGDGPLSSKDLISDGDKHLLNKFVDFGNKNMLIPQSARVKVGAIKRKFATLEAYDENTKTIFKRCKCNFSMNYLFYRRATI